MVFIIHSVCDFMCQGAVKQLCVPKKVNTVTMKLAQDGRVAVSGYVEKSSDFLIFSGLMKPQSNRATMFIVLSDSAIQTRMEQPDHAMDLLSPTDGLPWLCPEI